MKIDEYDITYMFRVVAPHLIKGEERTWFPNVYDELWICIASVTLMPKNSTTLSDMRAVKYESPYFVLRNPQAQIIINRFRNDVVKRVESHEEDWKDKVANEFHEGIQLE